MVLPHVAEVAFMERRFVDVRACLGRLDPLACSSIAALRSSWT
jgi:hypothetical protein